jgi:hypothetical protein
MRRNNRNELARHARERIEKKKGKTTQETGDRKGYTNEREEEKESDGLIQYPD